MSLVGHWPLHEWSGSAQDLSGNGNTGTVNGATQGVYGVGGLTAYSFDGTDDEVDVTGNFPTDSVLSISAWVRKTSSTSTGNETVVDMDSTQRLAYEDKGSNGFEANLYDGSSWNTVTSGVSTVEDWVHLVYVYSGSILGIYVNGVLEGVKSVGTPRDTDTSDSIGSVSGSNALYFSGNIADVRVYDHALSPQEIQTLYEWGNGDYTNPTLHDGTDSGAVSRYEFSSGSVTADSWGSNTLTDNTSAGTTTDAIRGDAKSFDGSDDYMDIGTVSEVDISNSFSASVWMKPADLTSYNLAIGNYVSNSNRWAIGTRDGDKITARVYDGSSYNESRVVPSGGEWYHVVLTWDAANLVNKSYINGVPMTGTANGIIPNAGDFSIGRDDDGTDYFDGLIDDVRIYSRALSAAEVAQLYRWGTRGRDMRHRMVIR